VGAAHGAGQPWPRLDDLLRRSRLAVAGTVTRSASFDDGRVVVAFVRPDRVLKGDAGSGEVAVVEEHDLPSSPTLLPSGQHAVVFLVRAPHTSSLARVLPAGQTSWVPLDAQMGVLASPSAEAIREAGGLVARRADMATNTTADPAARAEQLRALAFDEIAAAQPVVVEDGAAAVAALPDLNATLTDREQHRLEAALGRADLPARVRVALVRAVEAQLLAALVPALRALRDAPPDVLAASWQALGALGGPMTATDLAPFLQSSVPGVRAVAVPALLAAQGAAAVPQVERIALTERDVAVGAAAATALGAAKVDGGLAALERIYAKAPSEEVREAAGNALVAWGGDGAADALARLAFDAPPGAQKRAVTLLFLMGRTEDDPRIVRIRTTHPDPSVRSLVEHGFDLGTHHH
jgi:HEAT repeats